MKIKSILLAILCVAGFALKANAQQQKYLNFTAAAVNADGLPQTVLGQPTNEDGLEGEGATMTGNTIAKSNWDVIGLSEDFNFHSELTAPLSGLYNIGTHGGGVSGLSNSTDGLGFLLAKRTGSSFTGETRVAWNDHYGETSNGSDGLIKKGFRYYAVTLGSGFVVDVYVLHMDASDSQEDIDARTSQLKQLATYIKEHNNNRPILIIGDTNCRYTRDTLEEDLINSINSTSNMTIKDAWVEIARGGSYPTFGTDALMVHALGDFKGEVVDKLFYINITGAPVQIAANNYKLIRPASWGSDHPVATANFTLTHANGVVPTVDESKYTVDAPTAVLPTIQGGVPESGKTYYLMNVATKQYLMGGAQKGIRCVMGYAGLPITLQEQGGKYRLACYDNVCQIRANANPWTDETNPSYDWDFNEVDAVNHHYNITCAAGALTPGELFVTCSTLDASNDNQKWMIMTAEQMKEQMQKTTTSFDCTPLIPTAEFGRNDYYYPELVPGTSPENATFKTAWTGVDGWVSGQAHWLDWNGADSDIPLVNYCVAYTGFDAASLNCTLANMPKGTYEFSCEGFWRYIYYEYSWFKYTEKEGSMTAKVTIGDQTISLTNKTDFDPGWLDGAAIQFRDNDTYKKTVNFTTTGTSDLALTVSKTATSAKDYSSKGYTNKSIVAIDKFRLIYKGNGETQTDPTLEHRYRVAQKINDTWEKVKLLNEAGQAAYDVTAVINMYENGKIQNEDDANHACDLVDIAYANAVNAAHLVDVNNAYNNPNGDLSTLIVNPSFETGDLTGWDYKQIGDTKVYTNSNATYTVSNADGDYIFNTYDGDASSNASYVKQTITGLKLGLYKVSAKLTSFENRTSFLIGNHAHKAVKVSKDKTQLDAVELLFLVEEGEATIGAIGGSEIDGDYSYYMPNGGGFLKADDFKLNYICDLAHGRLKLAIDKANEVAAKFDAKGKAAFNISSYETMYANKTLTSDGKAEAQAVYTALATAAKAQNSRDADMTYAISNPSFETGDYTTGWTTTVPSEGADTKVALQDDGTYTYLGVDGTYLFNSWHADAASSPVAPVTQTVSGLTNGKYRLTAKLASDNANTLYIRANNTNSAGVNSADKGRMALATVEFSVTDGTATISAFAASEGGTVNASTGGQWYKADDFRLTFLGSNVTLNENSTTLNAESGFYAQVTVYRTAPYGKWSTLVLPYTIDPAPEELIVKEFTGATLNGGYVDLTFKDATKIEAGVPYMVAVKDDGDDYSFDRMTNVELNMETPSLDLGAAIIYGTYVKGNVPKGAYFISDNKYYCAADNTNVIKGFRCYIDTTPAGAEAKGVRCVFGDFGDGTTGIDGVVDAEAAKVIAVFSVDGRRLKSLQNGINIVKMSDGTTKKVFVK